MRKIPRSGPTRGVGTQYGTPDANPKWIFVFLSTASLLPAVGRWLDTVPISNLRVHKCSKTQVPIVKMMVRFR